jgi:SPP1 family predicted phage head-tail adaptor
MRDSVELLLPDTCYILTNAGTVDGSGGVTESWGTAETANCRLDTINGNYRNMAGAVQTYNKLILSLPYDTTITEANRVYYNSTTYQVTSVNDGSWLATKRAEVQKV